MKFSTKTTYGLRAMIVLAENWGDDNLSLATIAKEEGISVKYLERIFSILKKEKLIISEKGVNGGYTLAQDPRKVSIYSIVRALEGKMTPFHCLDETGKVYCSTKCNCGATSVLVKVQEAINSTLKSINLNNLTGGGK
jgi:Rrf2 family transcriptional regulator, cysteine metabolism repressor